MADTIKESDHTESLKNGPFSYNGIGVSIDHIRERLGGVLTSGNRPFHIEDDDRYPENDSLKTIQEKFNKGKIGLNSVPEGNEVKFRNAVLSELTPANIGGLEKMPVGNSGLDIEDHPDVSGVTVSEVNGIRGSQKYISEVRFTRRFGVQQDGNEALNIEDGLTKEEAEVFLGICDKNLDANRLTQGDKSELDGIMTPRVVIITPDYDNSKNRDGIRTVMKNTGVPPISYMVDQKIIS